MCRKMNQNPVCQIGWGGLDGATMLHHAEIKVWLLLNQATAQVSLGLPWLTVY
jgi:hypothetical protein